MKERMDKLSPQEAKQKSNGNTAMNEFKLEAGYSSEKFISSVSFKGDGKTFELRWSAPVSNARIVRVDSCLLRIDLDIEENPYQTPMLFPKTGGHGPSMSDEAWGNVRIIYRRKCRTYIFN